jgi:hypothetical protein
VALRLCRIVPLGLVALASVADDAPTYRILRGEVLTWAVRADGGEFTWRGVDLRSRTCHTTPATAYMTGEKRAEAAAIQKGATIEFVAGATSEEDNCTALTVYLRLPPLRRSALAGRTAPHRPSVLLDNLWPRGNLTYTGIVSAIDARQLRLRTRQGDEHLLVLRDDTAFRHQGRQAEREDLPEQTRVYVRCGKNLFGEVEVYHVIWGEIQPTPTREDGQR